jgi:2-alkenal reductase
MVLLTFLLMVSVAGGSFLAVSLAQRSPSDSAAAQSTDNPQDAVTVVQQVSPAVVTVINEQTQRTIRGAQTVPVGIGTGFFIDEDGHVVTNQHVVAGGDDFVVVLSDGSQLDAQLVGADQVSDLAVLQVEGDVPATVPFGDSEALMPGETVLAIGSALGTFSNTVTEGIVSATNRTPPEFQGGGAFYTNLIQHDAAINPGNSGGPLFNLDGEVVGVNTLGVTSTAQGVVAQGLFFAIPSNTVQEVVTELIEDGEVVYPFFGITSVPVTASLAAQLNLPVDHGELVVQDVDPSSPAGRAGIQAGDIILTINGVEINQQNPFVEVLFSLEPGQTVDVTYLRDGEEHTAQITLGERPQ